MIDRGESSRKRGTMFFTGAKYDYIGTHTKEGYFVVPNVKLCPVKKHIVGSSKDTGIQSVSQNSGMATPMLRLAEVYLLYAEAILGTGSNTSDEDALYYFNLVRKRAGLDGMDEITLQDIWNERRCELAMEGQFWYDIVRRGYWDTDWVVEFMKNQKNRSMKVYSQNGRNYKATPTIILKGQWLEEMGFAIGDYISVSCENGKLVITPDTERAELEQMKADFMEKETKKLRKRFQREKEELYAQFVAEKKAQYMAE